VQLRLDALLGLQQSVPVAGERAQLGQGRGGHRQGPPVRMLMAQRVGQSEGVEDVVLAAGHPVALPSTRSDPRVDRKDAVPAGLQPLNE
jgi:hypothetical protein